MRAVATGAVRDDLRSQARRQSVIARQISRGSAPFDAKLLRQSDAFMASRAGGLGYVLRRYRRIRVRVRLDGVDPVAVGAHGRLPVRPREGLAVDALLKLLRNLLVALAACQRNIEFEDGRLRIFSVENFVRA